jgi:rsbT co-antagonist protein RsbR
MNDDGVTLASQRNQLETELLASVGTILNVLKAVAERDLSQRLALTYSESHPVGALAASVNAMIEALSEARNASAAYLAELNERIETIERQREAIQSLSVPIIEVWSGVLCIPVVGVLDSARAADVMTALLTAIVSKKAKHAIIDVTGIEVMDTMSADHFLRMAKAVTLLGAECALSGVHPNIARTIVHMGVELEGLKCYHNMRQALRYCVQQANARALRHFGGPNNKNGR